MRLAERDLYRGACFEGEEFYDAACPGFRRVCAAVFEDCGDMESCCVVFLYGELKCVFFFQRSCSLGFGLRTKESFGYDSLVAYLDLYLS